ncbi:MAG: PpiC protein [Bacteroidetes bacterium]|nr:PpiC protein [Bacteroidota bacterium]
MVFIVLAALLLCGCATFEPPDPSQSLPEVVYQSSLPPWPFHTNKVSLNMTFRIHIAADGTVNKAIIETPSGSKEWDALAIAQVRKWRYSPALMNGQPAALWLRQTITLHFDEPLYMKIAELTCPQETLADSLYALLLAGASFDSLARQFSVSDSRTRGGVVGEMDVHTLPARISREVATLHGGEFTKPLKLGRQYVIYKRLANGV